MTLSFFKRRLPPRVEISAVFGVAVFFVYSWSVRGFLYKLPSFMLYFSFEEILAVFSYMMAVALLESFLVTVGLIFLGFVLPDKFLRDGFSYKGFFVLLVGAITMIFFQGTIRNDLVSFGAFYTAAGLSILVLIVLILLVHNFVPLQGVVKYVVDGLGVFVYFYIPVGVISMLAVIIRNIF